MSKTVMTEFLELKQQYDAETHYQKGPDYEC